MVVERPVSVVADSGVHQRQFPLIGDAVSRRTGGVAAACIASQRLPVIGIVSGCRVHDLECPPRFVGRLAFVVFGQFGGLEIAADGLLIDSGKRDPAGHRIVGSQIVGLDGSGGRAWNS